MAIILCDFSEVMLSGVNGLNRPECKNHYRNGTPSKFGIYEWALELVFMRMMLGGRGQITNKLQIVGHLKKYKIAKNVVHQHHRLKKEII
jgi:hypothetical protein